MHRLALCLLPLLLVGCADPKSAFRDAVLKAIAETGTNATELYHPKTISFYGQAAPRQLVGELAARGRDPRIVFHDLPSIDQFGFKQEVRDDLVRQFGEKNYLKVSILYPAPNQYRTDKIAKLEAGRIYFILPSPEMMNIYPYEEEQKE